MEYSSLLCCTVGPWAPYLPYAVLYLQEPREVAVLSPCSHQDKVRLGFSPSPPCSSAQGWAGGRRALVVPTPAARLSWGPGASSSAFVVLPSCLSITGPLGKALTEAVRLLASMVWPSLVLAHL